MTFQTSPEMTFLFTDIVGSTELWEVAPNTMLRSLLVHNEVVRRVLNAYGGVEVSTSGDSFLLVFAAAQDALCCAMETQTELLNCSWPPELLAVAGACPEYAKTDDQRDQAGADAPGPPRPALPLLYRGLRVRMGMHTGAAYTSIPVGNGRVDYLGPDVNKASRACDLALGGELLATEAATLAAEGDARYARVALPAGLGAHTLRGFAQREMLTSFLPTALAARARRPSRCMNSYPRSASVQLALEYGGGGGKARSASSLTGSRAFSSLSSLFGHAQPREEPTSILAPPPHKSRPASVVGTLAVIADASPVEQPIPAAVSYPRRLSRALSSRILLRRISTLSS